MQSHSRAFPKTNPMPWLHVPLQVPARDTCSTPFYWPVNQSQAPSEPRGHRATHLSHDHTVTSPEAQLSCALPPQMSAQPAASHKGAGTSTSTSAKEPRPSSQALPGRRPRAGWDAHSVQQAKDGTQAPSTNAHTGTGGARQCTHLSQGSQELGWQALPRPLGGRVLLVRKGVGAQPRPRPRQKGLLLPRASPAPSAAAAPRTLPPPTAPRSGRCLSATICTRATDHAACRKGTVLYSTAY